MENVQVHPPSLHSPDSGECIAPFVAPNLVFHQEQWGDFHLAKSDSFTIGRFHFQLSDFFGQLTTFPRKSVF